MFRDLLESFIFNAFPLKCAGCDNFVERTRLGNSCSECWDKARKFGNGETICEKCGKLLSLSGIRSARNCNDCSEMHFDTARAAAFYEAAVSATVLAMKKEPHFPAAAKRLFLFGFNRSQILKQDLIIPVPLSRKRQFERGFNQAEILAKFLATEIGVPLDTQSLCRIVHSPLHRAGMDRIAREASVKDAFKVLRPKLIENRRILLIDDVLTTGVSASYCAATLKKAGAARVDVFTFSRAV